MKITMWRLLAALLMLPFTIASPAAARPAPVFCDTVLSDTVIRGDLVVPERSHCELNNVTVLGDVRMRGGAGFTPYDSRIAGNITGAQFELLHLLNTTVEGSIRLRGGVRVELGGATIVFANVKGSHPRSKKIEETGATAPMFCYCWGSCHRPEQSGAGDVVGGAARSHPACLLRREEERPADRP
jgi:hypothetical protein